MSRVRQYLKPRIRPVTLCGVDGWEVRETGSPNFGAKFWFPHAWLAWEYARLMCEDTMAAFGLTRGAP